MKRFGSVLVVLAVTAACEGPSTPVAGSFNVRVNPDPVVFRQLYPGATTLNLASPPPPDPRFYSASLTVIIAEDGGGGGHLEAVETELVSSDGVAVRVGAFDGACDFNNELTRGGNRTIPPNGRLEWCIGRLATPDITRTYSLRVTPRIVDELGSVSSPSETFRVAFRP